LSADEIQRIDERREREEFTCAPDTGGRESAGLKADYFVYVFDRGNSEVGKGGCLSVMVRNVTQVSN
jgi:hypothetical protein